MAEATDFWNDAGWVIPGTQNDATRAVARAAPYRDEAPLHTAADLRSRLRDPDVQRRLRAVKAEAERRLDKYLEPPKRSDAARSAMALLFGTDIVRPAPPRPSALERTHGIVTAIVASAVAQALLDDHRG